MTDGTPGLHGQPVISERPLTANDTRPLLFDGEDVTVREPPPKPRRFDESATGLLFDPRLEES